MILKTRVRKLWIPYDGFRLPPPRLTQLLNICYCFIKDHNYSRWRIETEDWFEHVDEPIDWSWRTCRRCSLIERVVTCCGRNSKPLEYWCEHCPLLSRKQKKEWRSLQGFK